MAKLGGDNVGAQSKDGIQAKVGITFLPTNKTMFMLPLQGDDCPTDPDDMIISGNATYTLDNMYQKVQPQVDVSLKTGDDANPLQDVTVPFKNQSDFDPEKIVDNVPLLSKLRDQQQLIQRVEQLLQEGAFQRMLKDKNQKAALVGFLQSVIDDIETHEKD